MRKQRVFNDGSDLFNPLLSEPCQSFTPRQILEQFARNELSCVTFDPSDSIDGDSFSDDVMEENVISFEDAFEAREYLQTTKVKKRKKDEVSRSQSSAEVGDGSEVSSEKSDGPVSDMVDMDKK